MRATGVNHVSIQATDLEESARFYEELLGMERLPTPNFGTPVQWMRLGDRQLHLFLRNQEAPRFHHLGIDVDDFEAVYLKAKKQGLLDFETFGAALRAHPSGWVQMYIRDPAGNLVEIDTPDGASIDRSVVTDIVDLDDEVEQVGDERTATIYTALGQPAR